MAEKENKMLFITDRGKVYSVDESTVSARWNVARGHLDIKMLED